MAIDFSITSAVTPSGRAVYNVQRINSTETKFNIGAKTRYDGNFELFVHWATNDTNHRKTQVATAIEMYKENIKSYHNHYGLDHLPANVSQMICDVRQQGGLSVIVLH